MKEIGSEFWNNKVIRRKEANTEKWMEQVDLLSGRTAIFAIAEELKGLDRRVVYMPEFACESMIEPFTACGISLLFYDVYFERNKLVYDIDFEQKFDALFIMQYFGYQNEEVFGIINKAKERGKLVIEDATHSFFQERPFSEQSDYVFASLRKWCAIAGGAVLRKKTGSRKNRCLKENWEFIRKRREAAQIKEKYMESKNTIKKEIFLRLFCEAEKNLDESYVGYAIDQKSREELFYIDWKQMREKRRENAELLIENLKDTEGIQLLYTKVRKTDAPLFVPVLLENKQRDDLRSYLIKRQIYCPVHWKRTICTKEGKDLLFEKELSLICDQRYGKEEMEYIYKNILEWIKNYKGSKQNR